MNLELVESQIVRTGRNLRDHPNYTNYRVCGSKRKTEKSCPLNFTFVKIFSRKLSFFTKSLKEN